MNKELKRKISLIVFSLYDFGYYPMITFNNVNGDMTKVIRFYLNDKDKVSSEVIISNEFIRKTLTEDEIIYCLNNIDNYEKYKRVGY